jgi:hypothetical protein
VGGSWAPASDPPSVSPPTASVRPGVCLTGVPQSPGLQAASFSGAGTWCRPSWASPAALPWAPQAQTLVVALAQRDPVWAASGGALQLGDAQGRSLAPRQPVHCAGPGAGATAGQRRIGVGSWGRPARGRLLLLCGAHAPGFGPVRLLCSGRPGGGLRRARRLAGRARGTAAPGVVSVAWSCQPQQDALSQRGHSAGRVLPQPGCTRPRGGVRRAPPAGFAVTLPQAPAPGESVAVQCAAAPLGSAAVVPPTVTLTAGSSSVAEFAATAATPAVQGAFTIACSVTSVSPASGGSSRALYPTTKLLVLPGLALAADVPFVGGVQRAGGVVSPELGVTVTGARNLTLWADDSAWPATLGSRSPGARFHPATTVKVGCPSARGVRGSQWHVARVHHAPYAAACPPRRPLAATGGWQAVTLSNPDPVAAAASWRLRRWCCQPGPRWAAP